MNIVKILGALAVGATLVAPLKTYATPIGLGGASGYAVLGTGGSVDVSDFEVYQSGTVVNGNIGMGPNSALTHNIDALINGNFDYDLTSTLDGKTVVFDSTKGVQGSVNQIDMTGIVADARSAAATAAGFAATQTFATLTEDQVINGVAGLNVIKITGDVSLKKTLTINGAAGSQFIFQLASSTGDGHDVLNFSGLEMTLTGGLSADDIVWNLLGLGGGINISGGGTHVYGNFLAPDRDIHVESSIVDGRLIGGGSENLLSLHSTTFVNQPTTEVPEPNTLALVGLGLGLLVATRRRLLA